MSQPLPVPSKGALRALRHIALGASCTVAFGVGLITEDLRRRIHTAREVSENARRLKTSRQYHNGGLSVARTFEEQVEDYYRYGPWKGRNIDRILNPDWSSEPSNVTSLTQSSQVDSKVDPEFPALDSTINRPFGKSDAAIATNLIFGKPPGSPRIKKTPLGDCTTKRCKIFHTQDQLATKISTILKSGSNARVADSALTIFNEAIQKDLEIRTLNRRLLDVCILLAQECDKHDSFDKFIPVLQKILSSDHPIDEESFYRLHVDKVISRLLEQSEYWRRDGQVGTRHSKLWQAVDIFMTPIRGKPKPFSREMRDIGLQLCNATLQAKLYRLTEMVYWRLLNARTDFTASEVEILILAEHGRTHWGEVLSYFSRFFSKTLPNQEQIYSVVNAAIDSALELKTFDLAEKVLFTAGQMVRDGNLVASTTWYLRVLGEHWRTTRNIASTQALFDRLEAFFQYTSHPQAMYSAIVQFCVECGKEGEAQRYLERLKQACGGDSLDLRTYGHLALAKAMKNDWKGVEADFYLMKSHSSGSTPEYSDIFVPILKLFVESHDVTEVENFLRLYIEKLGVVPNQYIYNILIDVYCRAGEIRSLPAWLDYVRPLGLQIDAVAFNTILSSCLQRWGAHFEELYRLCKRTQENFGSIIDSTTIRILCSAARRSSNPRRAFELLEKIKPPTRVKSDKLELAAGRDLAQARPKKVLNSFKFALKTKIPISPRLLNIAVRASIESAVDGNLAPTIQMLAESRSRGLDISPSIRILLLHQLDVRHCSNGDLLSVIKNTLAKLDESGLEVTISVASKVTSKLIDRGRPEQAIMLWNTIESHYRISRQSIDIVLLTVLLRAYIMLSDLHGIKWVMAVLGQTNIMPDKRFKLHLQNARREARRFMDAQPESLYAKQRYDVLNESVLLYSAHRLRGEVKREEAEQLTLSILEDGLAVKHNTTLGESRQGLLEALDCERVQSRSLDKEDSGQYDNGFGGVQQQPRTRRPRVRFPTPLPPRSHSEKARYVIMKKRTIKAAKRREAAQHA